jgi:hypothetical protein
MAIVFTSLPQFRTCDLPAAGGESTRAAWFFLGRRDGLQSTFEILATRAHLRQKKRGGSTSSSNLSTCLLISRLDQSQRVLAMARTEQGMAKLRKLLIGGILS